MRFTLDEIAHACAGRIEHAGPTILADGLSTDTREPTDAKLFVALHAARDGYEFIPAAAESGAAAYLSDRPATVNLPGVIVASPAEALIAIGRHARTRIPDRVVGITGSVGKTTVKDLVAAVLATTYETFASTKSHNNEIGVPLTLANAPTSTEAVVVEMGARAPQDISKLCAIARPTIGIVTRVGLAHTEYFGTLEGVAAAKGELIESLPESGTAIVNADDPLVSAMAVRTSAHVLTFGTTTPADITASTIAFDDLARPTFLLRTPQGTAHVTLSLHGAHQVANAVAAAAAGTALGIPPDQIAKALADVAPATWRMSIERLHSGALLLDDSYNANPTSTKAALDTLAGLGDGRRMAILGSMEELGPDSHHFHREVASFAEALGIEVIAYATTSYGLPPVTDPPALLEKIGPLGASDSILVKGSRAAAMESVAAMLRGIPVPTDPPM